MTPHNPKPTQQVIGAFEKVSFPEYGITDIVAKIDTGAYTGAFHATNISEQEKAGKMVLHFSPFDHQTAVFTTDKYYIKHVKSSNGVREKRYVIDTEITIGGQTYPIILTLADRSDMKCPVLIGRRFMRTHDLLVDVTKINK
jgi:hypothetical protein